MVPTVPAEYIGCSSLLTSRQVKNVTEVFDLKITKHAFDFVFRLYNFAEVADEPQMNVGKLHSEVEGMNLRGLTALTIRKRKTIMRVMGVENFKWPLLVSVSFP